VRESREPKGRKDEDETREEFDERSI